MIASSPSAAASAGSAPRDTATHQPSVLSTSAAKADWEEVPAYRHQGVSRLRLGLTLVGVSVYNSAFYQTLKKPWWSGDKSDFHVINDWWANYSMEVDKLAHAFAGQSMALTAARSYEWSGMSRRQALFWGGVTGLATLTQVEVLDGYTREYGFSTADCAANVAGAFFPLMQEMWRPLRLLTFKMSYHTARFEPGRSPGVLEDYNRQTYWLALDVDGVLPRNARGWWPDWLGVAVGYGVDNAFASRRDDRVREFYVAFDFDPTRAVDDGGWLAGILAPLHYIHFPAPAIRIREDGTKVFALYF